jgi:hypothetical protein
MQNPDQPHSPAGEAELIPGRSRSFCAWQARSHHFRRTLATRDTEINGQAIGRAIRSCPGSLPATGIHRLNDDPYRMDVTCNPNDMAFGRGGPHMRVWALLAPASRSG